MVLVIIKHMESLMTNGEDLYKEKKFFTTLAEKLTPILKDPAERRMLNTFNTEWWLEAKLKSTSIEEVAKTRN